MYDPAYTPALFRLATAIARLSLGAPLSVGWVYAAPHQPPYLRVQVEAKDLRPWVDAMDVPTFRNEPVEDQTHVHVEGYLAGSENRVPLHLVTVMDTPSSVEVGK